MMRRGQEPSEYRMSEPPKVLVATDFSQLSSDAVAYASAHAKMIEAVLLIVHVHEVPTDDHGEGMLHYGVEREDLSTVERRLKQIRPSVEGVTYETRLLKGQAAAEILRLARDENVALIVLGTHGRTGLARVLMGSVAEQVVRGANCPVMTIKTP